VYPSPINIGHPVDAVRIVPLAETRTSSQQTATAPMTASPDPAVERIAELLTAVTESVQELEQRRQASLLELQQAAVELAIAAASHIVETAINAEFFPVDRLVQSAIERLGWVGPTVINLHPEDLRRFRSHTELQTDLTSVEWRSDSSLARGSCRAERPEGAGVLYDIDRQLADIRRLWLENLDDTQIERRLAPDDGQSLRRFPDRREALERA